MKNRKILLAVCSLSLMAYGLIACDEGNAESSDSNVINMGAITQRMATLAVGVSRVMAKKNLLIDDVSKINFSLPGTSEYKKNIDMNIYSAEGGQIGEQFNSNSLIPLADSTNFIFTLSNSVRNIGTNKTELIAVLPNVKKFACEHYEEQKEKSLSAHYYKDFSYFEGDINLSASHEVLSEAEVIVLPSKYGCVVTKSGIFYYHVLLER